MTLLQLQYFRAIAEMQHFTKAAEKLMISQSNLSHAIRELEEELGAKLFMRQGRNIRLTRFGEIFLPYVNQSLEVLEEGKACLADYLNPNTGTIRLAAQPSLTDFTSYLTVRYLSETGRTNVNFQILQEGTYAGICQSLTQGKSDFVLSNEVTNVHADMIAIGHHDLVVLVSQNHPLAKHDKIRLEMLQDEKFIPYDHTCQLRSVTDHVFERLNIRPKITFETAQDHVIHALVSANQGVSIVPRPLGVVPYNVKVLEIENELPKPRKIYLSWNKEAYLSPAAECFKDFVRSQGMIFDEYRSAIRLS